MGKRIEWLIEAEVNAVDQKLEQIQILWVEIGDTINGRVPAAFIDKWLKIERLLHSFRVNRIDELRDNIGWQKSGSPA